MGNWKLFNKGNFPLRVILIAIIALIGIGLIIIYLTVGLNNVEKVSLYPKESQQTRRKQDSYIDWKAFRNTTPYYVVMYPKDFSITEQAGGGTKLQFATKSGVDVNNLDDNALVTLEIIGNPEHLAFSDWYQKQYGKNFTGKQMTMQPNQGFKEQTKNKVYQVSIYIVYGSDFCRLTGYFPKKFKNEYLPILDKMATSFTFQQ